MCLRFSLIVSVVLLLMVSTVFLLCAQQADGSRLVDNEDFTLADGWLPSDKRWTTYNRDTNDFIRIETNTMRAHIIDEGNSYVEYKDELFMRNFTVLYEWKPRVMSGRVSDFRLLSNVTGRNVGWLGFHYGADYHGWVYYHRKDDSLLQHSTYTRNAEKDKWYILNVTVKYDRVDLTATDKATGTVVFSGRDIEVDPFPWSLRLRFGVFASVDDLDPSANFDNWRLYDNDVTTKMPPVWGQLPHLHAVEDVPYDYDFTSNVSDPDGPKDQLTIRSLSPFVTQVSGFEVTFIFPNGVHFASVPLLLSDAGTGVVGHVEFTITPVNGPPSHNLPTEHWATEDVPYRIDFSQHVWDADNEVDELTIGTDDAFAKMDRLIMMATFPEGVLEHNVWVNISDGMASTWVNLTFWITPVDDPPVIGPLGELDVIEDHVRTFNVAPFLSDVDTPLDDLTLLVEDGNCTVVGHTLEFLYTLGGFDDVVTVQVTDASSIVKAELLVRVIEWNDPPTIRHPLPVVLVEDEPRTIDLGPYIEDEDTPVDQLVLECDHPNIVELDGLSLVLLYDEPEPDHPVRFSVHDGSSRTNASFWVQVVPHNDNPRITGIGHLLHPFEVVMDEGTTVWMAIVVEDEDDETFLYAIESPWKGMTVLPNGTLRLVAEKGEIGSFSGNLTVEDTKGAKAWTTVDVRVVNVNDPISGLVVLSPANNTVIDRGSMVNFGVDVVDPDLDFGQVITVTWWSDLSGDLMVLTTEQELSFSTNGLSPGVHRIRVTATDGEHEREAYVTVTINDPDAVPPMDPGEGNLWALSGSIVALVIIVVLVVAVALLWNYRRREAE